MIYDVLNFLKLRLDRFVNDGRLGSEPLIVLSPPWNNTEGNKGASFLNSMSLISVEEEKVFKTQVPPITQHKKNKYSQRAPDIKLNLYILVSAYNKSYDDALKFISKVISYFQVNYVFAKDDPDFADLLPDTVEKIVAELYTATFEQQNQIWASLGTGYLPSVIYKLRTIVVDGGDERDIPVIEKIKVSTKVIASDN